MEFVIYHVAIAMAWLVTMATSDHVNMTAWTDSNTLACALDGEELSTRLSACYKRGDKSLVKYHKHVRSTRGSHQDLDRCQLFWDFAECIETLSLECPAVTSQLSAHWRHLLSIRDCACNPDPVCQETIQCFEGQYGGILGRRCEALFRFNVKQRTRKKCHFLQENATCKEKLLTSACGNEAGALAAHMTLISPKSHVKRNKCNAPDDIELKWFSYTPSCPPDFPAQTVKCFTTHIRPRQVAFYAENDLVVDGSIKEIQDACNDIMGYHNCIEPIRNKCPDGVKLVQEFVADLRPYLSKMEYICGGHRKAYMAYLPCYSQVLAGESLRQCEPVWLDLEPMLHIVTAYDFFCLPASPDSVRLQQSLDGLRACYDKIFTSRCGARGGQIMGHMIKTAFADPFYLRYKYKPNCEQHRRLREYNEMRASANEVSRHMTRDTSRHQPFQDSHNYSYSSDSKSVSQDCWLSTWLILILFTSS